jgi:uncharacterized protein YaaQ
MIGAQWLLLCFVEADDAPHLLAALTAAGCGATERLGQGGPAAQGRVGVLVVASPGEVPLALAAVRRTCARRMAGHRHAALAMMLNPLAEVIGGATILALPVRNSARWALGDLPSARGGARRWEMLDAAVLEAEAISLARDQPTKLLVAVVPDRSVERVIQALAMRQCSRRCICKVCPEAA